MFRHGGGKRDEGLVERGGAGGVFVFKNCDSESKEAIKTDEELRE